MSRRALREELERRIAELGARIEQDQATLLRGQRADKVKAAGEIVVLRDRQRDLRHRLEGLPKEGEPEGGWEGFRTAIEEDLFDLDTAFQRWARKYH